MHLFDSPWFLELCPQQSRAFEPLEVFSPQWLQLGSLGHLPSWPLCSTILFLGYLCPTRPQLRWLGSISHPEVGPLQAHTCLVHLPEPLHGESSAVCPSSLQHGKGMRVASTKHHCQKKGRNKECSRRRKCINKGIKIPPEYSRSISFTSFRSCFVLPPSPWLVPFSLFSSLSLDLCGKPKHRGNVLLKVHVTLRISSKLFF